MEDPSTLLGGLSPERFLTEYWQKKPLLVRGALPGFGSPLTPEELAGLACEDDVEARLVLERGGDYPWQLRYGPFAPDDFAGLPETHWSLLVQEVDRLVPEVAALLDRFAFIPRWRIDDVMVSYAPAEGGVGPHVDNYDVFLVQGLGRRRWQIHHSPVEEEDLDENLDVRILRGFEPDAEWVLEPGDLLYLPPRIPHNGVALDDCMTFSVGFRAPSHEEIVAGYLGDVLQRIDPLARYADPALQPARHPGQIGADALEQVRAVIRSVVDDRAVDRWFGSFMTEPRRAYDVEPPEEEANEDDLYAHLEAGGVLRRAPGIRFAYITHDDGTAELFAAGEIYTLDKGFAYAAPLLAGSGPLDAGALGEHLEDLDFLALLVDLFNQGYLWADDEA